MLTNTGVTIYSRSYSKALGHDEWKKTYIPKAWWFEEEKSTLTAEGRINADVYTIRIPGTGAIIKKDDYIVSPAQSYLQHSYCLRLPVPSVVQAS